MGGQGPFRRLDAPHARFQYNSSDGGNKPVLASNRLCSRAVGSSVGTMSAVSHRVCDGLIFSLPTLMFREALGYSDSRPHSITAGYRKQA